ncbi:hypothetical protein [Streptomonospora salina]|uniref:Guanylate cyclase domain-containing protein n=1 Tax=Streptomonospora salina TaxID=104205 RepID=A0A841E5V8_9ACTN|nr:hypothetical protein [Streptomonospora salina]MBB5998172.1 hypothetical protein [Streptomonospora salina]
MPARTRSSYYVIMVADIEGFGRRPDPLQYWLRERMYGIADAAMAASGIDFSGSPTPTDRGDGAFWLFPGTVPKVELTANFMRCLRAELRAYKQVSSADAELRLRIALHSGEVARDRQSWVGTDLNTACRLVDIAPLKSCLQQCRPAADLVLAVSQAWHSSVLRHNHPDISDDFLQVPFTAKEVRQNAWITVPGHPLPPGTVAGAPDTAPSPDADGGTEPDENSGEGGDESWPDLPQANTGRFAGARISAERVYGGDHNEGTGGRASR